MKIAITGATSLAGNEIISNIDNFSLKDITFSLFGDDEVRGELYQVGEDEAIVEELNLTKLAQADLVVLAGEMRESREIAERLADYGGRIVDVSYATDGLPGWTYLNSNQDTLQEGMRLTLPNPVATLVSKIVASIGKDLKVTDFSTAAYQSCAILGKDCLDELWQQTRAIYTQQAIPEDLLKKQLAFNVIPSQVIYPDYNKNTLEQIKILQPDLRNISCAALFAPLFHVDACLSQVRCQDEINLDCLAALFAKNPEFEVTSEAITPLEVGGSDKIHLSYFRDHASFKDQFTVWALADTLRFSIAGEFLRFIEKLASVSSISS
jgi:aspartate-semialdehyde dehydrogenase